MDVSPIDGLDDLTELDLHDNQVVDLAPIVSAPIFGQACRPFNITGNPLDANSVDNVIPALCAQTIVVEADVGECLEQKSCGPID